MTITIAATAACAVALGMRASAWSGRSHADLFGRIQGTAVPAVAYGRVKSVQNARGTGRDLAPATDVESAHLMAPPG